MFNLLGNLNPQDLMNALGELRSAADQMRCIVDEIRALRRTLEYEYGQPVRDIPAHDPRKLPLIAQLGAGQLDLQAGLGKPATRGHILNLGSAKANLYFERGPDRVGPYTLLAGAVLDLSFVVERLEVTEAGDGPVGVQVFAQ
ncbi:MAG: hypothetical protein K6T57_12330 [Thermaceae bacterium]|nr:hypothetical protein [Thermaceae bacterium]